MYATYIHTAGDSEPTSADPSMLPPKFWGRSPALQFEWLGMWNASIGQRVQPVLGAMSSKEGTDSECGL